MKRLLIVLVALVAVFAMVLPASAADLKFGGMFWTKWYNTSNIRDGNDNNNDRISSFFYTRMRMYFTAIASENLRAVSKVEVDSDWGDGRIGRVSIDGGSDGRGDATGFQDDGSANSGFEVKNAYIDFTIPDTALNFKVGLLGAKLGKSGIIFNDDTPAIMASYGFSPFKVSLLYSQLNDNAAIAIAGPNSASLGTVVSPMTAHKAADNWNLWALDFTYQQEAIRASFDIAWAHTGNYKTAKKGTCGFGEDIFVLDDDGNVEDIDLEDGDVSLCDLLGDPSAASGAVDELIGVSLGEDSIPCVLCNPTTLEDSDSSVDHVNVGVDFDYTADMWSAYFTGAVNFGKVEDVRVNPVTLQDEDADFKGWMVTAGGNYNFSDMIGVGLDFYYASGGEATDDDIKSFQTFGVIGRPSYYMDDIVFPGWFDDETATVATAAGGVSTGLNNVTATGQTASNQGYTLNNIWSIGVHADFKPLEQTLIQPGFAYMQFAEDVVENARTAAELAAGLGPETGKDLGFSAYLRLNQGITDGLALKATFGYLFAGDAFTPNNDDDDAYKLAAGLFWSW
jgi:hypothetical protein